MPWVIVERVTTLPGYEGGHVETWEPGQDHWTPLFRSRRLNAAAKVRVCWKSAARFNFASRESFIVVGQHGTHILEITTDGLWNPNSEHVFFLRLDRLIHDLDHALVRNHRFEVAPPGSSITPRFGAARG